MKGAVATLLFVVAAGLGGCSDHGDPMEVENPPPGPDPISFAADIQPVFDAQCIGCHGVGGSAGLDLRSGVSHTNLVNVAANNATGDLVVPGDGLASVLVQRLTGTQGGFMPPTGPLPVSNQELVKGWIDEGALDN